MTVTSTQFQQKVGYYLELAEKGEEIQIQKLKPTKHIFKLNIVKTKQPKEKNIGAEILKKLKKYKVDSFGESGLELQRRVRS